MTDSRQLDHCVNFAYLGFGILAFFITRGEDLFQTDAMPPRDFPRVTLTLGKSACDVVGG